MFWPSFWGAGGLRGGTPSRDGHLPQQGPKTPILHSPGSPAPGSHAHTDPTPLTSHRREQDSWTATRDAGRSGRSGLDQEECEACGGDVHPTASSAETASRAEPRGPSRSGRSYTHVHPRPGSWESTEGGRPRTAQAGGGGRGRGCCRCLRVAGWPGGRASTHDARGRGSVLLSLGQLAPKLWGRKAG